MKRFVTYLFTYENGKKGHNAGFIRADQRERTLALEVHVQGIGRYQGKGQVFLLTEEDAELQGICIGEISVAQGKALGRLTYGKEEEAGDPDAEKPVGIAIRFGKQYYAASSWTERAPEGIADGTFSVKQPEAAGEEMAGSGLVRPAEEKAHSESAVRAERKPQPWEEAATRQEESAVRWEETATRQEETAVRREKAATQQEDAADLASEERHGGGMAAATAEETRGGMASAAPANLRRIDISDIRKLPKKNWYLCNNSFLIHGFFNYHYLVVMEAEEDGKAKTYLGVPGIYEKPERMMAMFFGFPDFKTKKWIETAPDGDGRIHMCEEPEAEQEGQFGYWLGLLDM